MKSLLAVILLSMTFSFSSQSFAHPSTCYYDPYGHWVCRHEPHPDEGDVIVGGFLAALLSSLTTSAIADHTYPAETLLLEAAQFQATGERGAVFEAFSAQRKEELAERMGVPVDALNTESIDFEIALIILQEAN